MRIIQIKADALVQRKTSSTLPFDFGYQGETGATEIRFDISAWRDSYGDGMVLAVNKRYMESDAYTLILPVDGDIATWAITGMETGVSGIGSCELHYRVGDEIVVKSGQWVTRVKPSIANPRDPPTPEHTYSGPYDVTPQVGADVELVTAQKYLTDDITVRQIPYQEVSNLSGGLTITIGG